MIRHSTNEGYARKLSRPDGLEAYPRRLVSARGQATIELLGLLPLVVLIGLVGFTLVASSTAHEQAGEAAEAGALALLQGGLDARTAAREALPEHLRARSTITVAGRRVHVRVRPRTPIAALSNRLTGEAHADAGPPTP